jgi:serine/threonine protein kinase
MGSPESPESGATLRHADTPENSAATQRHDAGAESGATQRHDSSPESGATHRHDDTAEPGTTQRHGEPAPRATSGLPIGPGSVVKGQFEIEALLGRGGMGSVYSALDRLKVEARDPDPRIAIKVLNADFREHPDAFVSLQREASKAQSLAHPNIVTVFNFDRDGDTVFLTMELLRGRSLEAFIREVRGSGTGRAAALQIVRGIAQGLAYAHRKGVVHSDLKPANVFVLDDGTPKILDFGVARAVPGARAGKPVDEFDAGRLGAYSEAYATAQMIDGADPAPADDLYALGVIACELLTGSHPFGRKSAPQAEQARLKPPALKMLRRHERLVITRALAFDRQQRPRDAGEFLRLLDGTAPWLKGLVAAVFVLTAASGFLWYRGYQQAGPAIPFDRLPPDVQQRVRTDLEEAAKDWRFYSGQGIGDALSSALVSYADAYRWHKGNREAVKGLQQTADEFLKRARGNPQQLHDTALQLMEASEYLKAYAPVADAAKP